MSFLIVNRQQGFVLAVVLWSMAALTLITGGIVARINNTLNQAYSMREFAQLDQDMMATEQTLLYMLSARPHNPAGVDLAAGSVESDSAANPFESGDADQQYGPTLRMDGSWYSGVGQVGFALQDAGASFSLLEPRRENWLRLMELLEVSPTEADRWYDQFMDYQDRDNLTRLNGAEEEDYRERGMLPPSNRFPVTPFEILNVPIAREHPDIADRIIRSSTIGTGTSSNLNTSPPLMLELVHYLSRSEAQMVASERGNNVLSSLSQASAEFGVLFQGGEFESLWQPSGNIRIMLGDRQGRHKRWIEVKFTATANGAPWVIEYSHPVSINQRKQEPAKTDAFGLPTTPETAPRANDWPYYSAFFPEQLPLD